MKICILTEYLSYIGGGERVYCNWANMWSEKLGHDVVILSLEDANSVYYELSPKVTIKSLKLRKYKYYEHPISRRLDMIFNVRKDISAINEYFKKNKFDIVVGIATNICLLLAEIKTNCPKIGTEHTEYYALVAPLRLFRNRLYPKLNYLTVLTESDCTLYKKFVHNVSVMLNPLSFPIEKNNQSSLENKTIVSVGSLSTQKNQRKMLDIFRIVREYHPDWKMQIFGEGPLRNQLETYSKQLNLSDSVSFPGAVKDIPKVLSQGSIFILTSKIEGFGLVLIEAMACGLPCVAFEAPGPNTIIQNGENGFLVKQGDIDVFAQKICKLIENKHLRNEMAINAILSIKKYSLESCCEAWDKLFTKLLQKESI